MRRGCSAILSIESSVEFLARNLDCYRLIHSQARLKTACADRLSGDVCEGSLAVMRVLGKRVR